MRKRRRIIVMLGVATLLIATAAPAVDAAKPSRVVLEPQTQVLPAGLGCAFDVELQPSSGFRYTETTFSDGRVLYTSSGTSTVTNLESDESVSVRDRGTLEVVYDAGANDLLIEANGQSILFFYPGDQGPFGTVGSDGGLYAIQGHLAETWDLDSDVITSFAYGGQATDLCALISSP